MLVVEAKLKNGTPEQYHQLDEAIKTSQFVRNSCVRYWLDNQGTTRNDLQKLCAVLANNKETPWVNKLNSQARQSAADRAWQSINRFYQNCRANISGKKGFPRFKKHSRSVEYKLTGYQLSNDRRKIRFTDGFKAGEFDLWCSQKTLVYYSEQQIKRVRVVNLSKSEKRLQKAQRRLSKQFRKGKKQSKNYHKQRIKVAKLHLKVSRRRKDKAIKDARNFR